MVKWPLGLLLMSILLPSLGVAAENEDAPLDVQPDAAFLEFLGSFAQEDDTWLDTALDEEQPDSAAASVEDTQNE